MSCGAAAVTNAHAPRTPGLRVLQLLDCEILCHGLDFSNSLRSRSAKATKPLRSLSTPECGSGSQLETVRARFRGKDHALSAMNGLGASLKALK